MCIKSQKKIQAVSTGQYDTDHDQKKIQAVSTGQYDTDHEAQQEVQYGFLGSIGTSTNPSYTWLTNIELGGSALSFRIDTGADVTAIPEKAYTPQMGKLSRPQKILYGPGRNQLNVTGMVTTEMKKGSKASTQDIYIVPNLEKPLLGKSAINDLEIIKMIGSIKDKYKDRFQGLGEFCNTYKITLRPDAKPFALYTPRRVAIPLLNKVNAELNRMESAGIITRVEEPTDWCAGMVVVPKPNGTVRICVDLTRLNESVKREQYIMPSVDETLAKMAGASVFSKLDANNGFWQVKLHPATAKLTTFITPKGRYYFNRLPYGLNAAPEYFMMKMAQILESLSGVVCQVDDILIYGANKQQHDERLEEVLSRLKTAGVTLNEAECEFGVSSVTYVGHLVSKDGIKPDPNKVLAIGELATPEDVGGVRRFLGMVNYLSKFVPHLAHKTKPLCDLLVATRAWTWGPDQQKSFDDIKSIIKSDAVLQLYDPQKETLVSTDASSYGMGAVLMQRQDDGEMKPVAFASRSLTSTEVMYAQIEKEALAATWASERFSMYLLGKCYTLETDHKPLIPLLSTKLLDEVPARVQQFRMRLMKFRYNIVHVPGKQLIIADTLSRAPRENTHITSNDLQDEVEAYVNLIMETLPATERWLQEIRLQLEQDEVLQQVMAYCKQGLPEHLTSIPGPVQPYWCYRGELTVQQGLLLKGTMLAIPSNMRLDILECIHAAHQGIAKCRDRAKSTVWWPGLSSQLGEMVKNCAICCKEMTNRQEPLIPSPLPDRPWQKLAADLCEYKSQQYLVVVDYYSRYFEMAKLSSTTSSDIINHLKSIYARHGISEVMMSDNGPQFSSSAFAQFAKEYGFHHITSSPTFAQSNGGVERAVQTEKNLIKKNGDPYLALLCYWATPYS